MRRFFCAVALLLGAVPALAQFTGTFDGPINVTDECDGRPVQYTSQGTAYLVQDGNTISGNLAVFINDCGGGGSFPVAVPFVGQVSGNSFTATVLFPSEGSEEASGTLNGNALSISIPIAGLGGTLNRTSSARPDTRLTGGSSGQGTNTENCTNGPITTTFSIGGSLLHTGNAIAGVLVASGPDFDVDQNGACFLTGETFTQPLFFSATISGSNIAGVLIIPDEASSEDSGDDVIPFIGSISGNTLSGGFSDSEGSIMFTITQTPGVTPPTVTSFTATPSSISPGQSSTLAWTTVNADSVTIDNGVGMRSASGSAVVSPAATTTYTLTATGPGGSATATTTVTVTGATPARIAVTSLPNGMVQAVGVATATDQYTLTNLGGTSTNITLTQSDNFFTQTPTSFTIAAGASQVVVVRATAQQGAQTFDGTSIVTGSGSAALTVPIKLAVVAPPAAPVVPSAVNTRPDVSAPANENPPGTVDFTNSGAGVLQGAAAADQPWLIPQQGLITIAPGETRTITFMSNRSLRPDGDAPVGGQTAKLSINYLDFPGSSAGFSASQASSGSSTNAISVSIVDVIKPGVGPGAPPALAAGERAVFAPGLPQRPNSLGDLLLSATGTSAISDLRLFFTGPGASALSTTLSQVSPANGVSLPSILKNVFSTPASSGTVQIRSANSDRVSVAAVQTNTASRFGSYITALPTFRSDVSLAPGSRSHLAGVEKGPSLQTNVYIQEVSGNSATAQLEFLAEFGNVIGTRPPDTIPGFGLLELNDVVPQGTRTVRVSNTSTGGARIIDYALVVDTITQDAWLVTDSTIGGPSTNIIVPVVSGPSSVTSETDIFVFNPQSSQMPVSFDVVPSGSGRRRSARSSASTGSAMGLEPNVATNFTAAPQQTLQISVRNTNTGFVKVTAPSTFSISSRSTLTVPPRAGAFGSALPSFAPNSALSSGQSRRFAGVDDSSQRTINARTPVTYRSNLGLVESAGQSAVVRVTLRYTFSAGTRTTAQGVSSKEFPMAPNQLLLISELSKTIIGTQRQTFGDLRNMQLDVEVLSGNGTVMPFLQVIDNGSGDMSIRAE